MGEFFQALWNAVVEWATAPEMQESLASLAGGALVIFIVFIFLNDNK